MAYGQGQWLDWKNTEKVQPYKAGTRLDTVTGLSTTD